MEWINEVEVTDNDDQNNTRICGPLIAGGVGAGIVACATQSMLCPDLCIINIQ